MIRDRLTARYLPKLAIERAVSPHETICEFLLSIVKTWTPDTVLTEFRQLFIQYAQADGVALECLAEIVLANREQEFGSLLRRACYILINNWDMARHRVYIPDLIHLFEDPSLKEETNILILGRLRDWVNNFINSQDFEALKLVTARYEDRGNGHWSRRYTSYLLAPQYANLENPLEQRQVAQKVSRQLKDKFKFDLAMYTARSECINANLNDLVNPTSLGDEVLRLVKKVVVKRGTYSYPNLAKIFLQQTENLNFQVFKVSLLEYLFFGIEVDEFAGLLKNRLREQLDSLYVSYEDQAIDESLLLRTVKRLTECLTIEKSGEPSPLFVLLSSQQNPLVLVILLLKLTLICRNVRMHLEVCIAHLVRYYAGYQEQDCAWVIQFLELFTIVLTIYSENVEYSLVNMQNLAKTRMKADLEVHRVFSLQKDRGVALLAEEEQLEEMMTPMQT
jgi:hypothetical protein